VAAQTGSAETRLYLANSYLKLYTAGSRGAKRVKRICVGGGDGAFE